MTNDWGYTSVITFPYVAQSAPNVVSTDAVFYRNLPFEESSKITAPFDFVLGGAWFSGYPVNADNVTQSKLQFRMYLDNQLVATSPMLDIGGTTQFLASGYAGLIDSFSIYGPQGYFVMDNLQVTPAAPVPEVGTAAMMLLGLSAVGSLARRRRAKAA